MSKVYKYDLQDRLVKFSADVIRMTSKMSSSYAAEHLSKQLIRSATSSALNYGEAQAAESRRDFLHKMKLCLKELRESELVEESMGFSVVQKEGAELVAIFTSSIKTYNSRRD